MTRAARGAARHPWWGGQQEGHWIAFYKFCQHIGVEYDEKSQHRLELWGEAAQTCGWWWPYHRVCIVSDRPEIVCWEADRERPRLHSENGPALRYRDGWSVWAWRGLRVPEWVIAEPQRITSAAIAAESNQELRRAMIERIGWDRYIREAGAREVQTDSTGTLLELPSLGDGDDVARFVRVRDPSTDRQYVLRVLPTVQTAQEAVAWTFGVSAETYQPVKES